jgi:hypothetical protein
MAIKRNNKIDRSFIKNELVIENKFTKKSRHLMIKLLTHKFEK